MPSPSLASYIKSDKTPTSPNDPPLEEEPPNEPPNEPPSEPPMREVSLPFPAPPYCGDFAIHIRRDGTWCYQNSPIRRQALCRLFASVLHKDADGQHWLITPAERGRITVELAPFLIAQCKFIGKSTSGELQLKTTLDEGKTEEEKIEEWKIVDKLHPIFMERRAPQPPLNKHETAQQETLPYFRINPQRRLDALIARSVFYQIAQHAEYDKQKNLFFIRSGKARFALDDNPTEK